MTTIVSIPIVVTMTILLIVAIECLMRISDKQKLCTGNGLADTID